MQISIRNFFFIAVLTGSLLTSPSEGAKSKCGSLVAFSFLSIVAGSTLLYSAYTTGERVGYQRALSDMARFVETQRQMGDERNQSQQLSLAKESFLLIHKTAKSSFLKEKINTLNDEDQSALRILVIVQKVRFLNDLLPETETPSMEEVFDKMDLPTEVAQEIKEKGLFDGAEYWPMTVEEVEPGRFKLNFSPPDSLKPFLRNRREKGKSKDPDLVQPLPFDREV